MASPLLTAESVPDLVFLCGDRYLEAPQRRSWLTEPSQYRLSPAPQPAVHGSPHCTHGESASTLTPSEYPGVSKSPLLPTVLLCTALAKWAHGRGHETTKPSPSSALASSEGSHREGIRRARFQPCLLLTCARSKSLPSWGW